MAPKKATNRLFENKPSENDQFLSVNNSQSDILKWVEAFILDRKAKGLAAGTIYFYQMMLKLFTQYLEQNNNPVNLNEITPNLVRAFMIHLEDTGHNPGGRHAAYRSLRALVYFWRDEVEPKNWKNPFTKVAAPATRKTPLPPIESASIQALLTTCETKTRTAERDAAIILSLADTGARANELLSMNRDDLDLITGEVYIRQGKGNKPRFVFIGKRARKAIRQYLKARNDNEPALWISEQGGRLTYWGLREMIRRRSKAAGIEPPGLHDFRRFFALACLRNGMDLHTLRQLMGHADLQMLQRYLALSNEDLQRGHVAAGPVDHLFL